MRPVGEFLFTGLLCLVVAALVAAGLFGFGILGTKATAAPLRQDSLQVLGGERTYSIALPRNFSPKKQYPIIVMLHGGAGNGMRIAAQTGLANYVDRDQFIAVFPDAGGRQWSDGRRTTDAGDDDVGFLRALVQHVASKYSADPGRAFLAGASNGGAMAMRLACEASDVFRAYVAVVAGLPEELAARCRPSRPVPIVFILSRDDPGVGWKGGERDPDKMGPLERRLVAGGRFLSSPDTVNFFARVNGCNGVAITDLPNRVNDGTSVRLHTYRCSGSPVLMYEIQGGGHAWPGSTYQRDPRLVQRFGVASKQINATEIAIDFFRKNGM